MEKYCACQQNWDGGYNGLMFQKASTVCNLVSLSLSLSHTHTHALSLFLCLDDPLYLQHSDAHTALHLLSHTHTHTHTHTTHTHTHTHTCTHTTHTHTTQTHPNKHTHTQTPLSSLENHFPTRGQTHWKPLTQADIKKGSQCPPPPTHLSPRQIIVSCPGHPPLSWSVVWSQCAPLPPTPPPPCHDTSSLAVQHVHHSHDLLFDHNVPPLPLPLPLPWHIIVSCRGRPPLSWSAVWSQCAPPPPPPPSPPPMTHHR